MSMYARILKWQFPTERSGEEISVVGDVVHCALQHGLVTVWTKTRVGDENVILSSAKTKLYITYTGENFPPFDKYVGTVQTGVGLVAHVIQRN